MPSANIKNYSIALEALSRMPGVETFSERIRDLLDLEIGKQEKANRDRYKLENETNHKDQIPF